MSEYGKIVGVTFEGRQQTLSELASDNPWREVTLIRRRFVNSETGITEPAIQIYDYKTKREMGWIAKNDLRRYDGITHMTAVIGSFLENNQITWYANLFLQGYSPAIARKVV